VGEVPGTPGLRGVLAARAFQQDETVILLPTRLAIGLGLQSFTAQVPWPDCLGALALYITSEGCCHTYVQNRRGAKTGGCARVPGRLSFCGGAVLQLCAAHCSLTTAAGWRLARCVRHHTGRCLSTAVCAGAARLTRHCRAAAQELAARMLRKRHANREWAASFDPFWASLPPVGGVYAKENWQPEHAAPLQDRRLVRARVSILSYIFYFLFLPASIFSVRPSRRVDSYALLTRLLLIFDCVLRLRLGSAWGREAWALAISRPELRPAAALLAGSACSTGWACRALCEPQACDGGPGGACGQRPRAATCCCLQGAPPAQAGHAVHCAGPRACAQRPDTGWGTLAWGSLAMRACCTRAQAGHVLTSANLAGIYPNLDLILLFEGNGLGRESLLGRRRSTC